MTVQRYVLPKEDRANNTYSWSRSIEPLWVGFEGDYPYVYLNTHNDEQSVYWEVICFVGFFFEADQEYIHLGSCQMGKIYHYYAGVYVDQELGGVVHDPKDL